MQRPGSEGERGLQRKYESERQALAFYDKQVLDYLNPRMREYIAVQDLMFVATSDRRGHCDNSPRAGEPGFVHVIDDRSLAYPEYRGNGVMASLGNISENPSIGLLFVDFCRSTIGLHVNGNAEIAENEEILDRFASANDRLVDAVEPKTGRGPERWVYVSVREAYIHCSKHIPLFERRDKDIVWGTDDPAKKGGDYFHAKSSPRFSREEE